jgi:hypothetical protein
MGLWVLGAEILARAPDFRSAGIMPPHLPGREAVCSR